MKKRFFSVLMLLAGVASTMMAQSKLSAYSRMYLNHHKTMPAVEQTAESADAKVGTRFPKSVAVEGKETVLTIITLENAAEIPVLPADATIETQIGRLLIVRVPIDEIEKMAEAKGIKRVSIEQPVQLKNKVGRAATLQDKVNEATDAAGDALKGKGVVVGVIDTGIDYNHINFKDADGKSRVKYVLNGSSMKEFKTESQIASLTTDNTTEDHGSHVTGTAAGSYSANGFQGMAPEADLALCGLNNSFSDANMLVCVKKIFDYAASVGKPAVINMSLGGNNGPHDGSDEICEGISTLVKEGAIVVMAAGNEGGTQLYLNKKFTATDGSVSSLLASSSSESAGNTYESTIQAYTFDGKFPSVQFFVYDNVNQKVLCKSDTIEFSKAQEYWSLSSSTTAYSNFSQYYRSYGGYSPNIEVYSDKQGNTAGLQIELTGQSRKSGYYYIGVTFIGADGQEIHAWGADSYAEFRHGNNPDCVSGTDAGSINNMACTPSVISVGAWTASNTFTNLNGTVMRFGDSEYPLNKITYFSSYGVDMNGMAHPDICAPGLGVISSLNSYYRYGHNASSLASRATSGSRTYDWGPESGTSMATPAVTGIVATWLQYKPTLTTAEIRGIMQKTGVKDSYVLAGDPVQWGAGKIDAYAGLQEIISGGVNDAEVSQNNVLVYPNPNGGQFKVFTQGEDNGATLSVYNVAGSLVYSSRINASQEAADIDLAGTLAPGVYVVTVKGDKVNYSTRMIIK